MRNVLYKGTYLYNRKNGRKRKGRVLQEEYDEVRVEGGLPNIVSVDLFDKVQSILTKGNLRPSKKSKHRYLLTGMLIDGQSGEQLHGESSVGGHSHHTYYHYKTKRGSSNSITIRKDYIEQCTANVLAKILNDALTNTQILPKCLNTINKRANSELTSVVSSITSAEKDLHSTIVALGRATDERVIDSINLELKAKQDNIEALKSRKAVLSAEIKDVSKFIKDVKNGNITITGNDLLNDEESFSSLLHLFIKNITIKQNKIVFNFN